MNVALQLVNWWRVALARLWHVCLEHDRDAVMFFWLCYKVLLLPPNVPEMKENKRRVNLLLTALFNNTRILKLKSQLTFAFFAAVNHLSGPRRKQKITSTGSKGHGLWLADFDPFDVSVFQGSLPVIVFIINGSENATMKEAFKLQTVCFWKV